MRTSDRDLVARVRAGDARAFELIDARYRARLAAFARRFLRDLQDSADDVVQEALWRAHRALRRDEREIELRSWLFALVRNGCLDELARGRPDFVSLDAPGAEPACELHSPATVHERRTRLADALAAIATLPYEQRHALVRSAVDGATHDEVAYELGISAPASRALVHRARVNLGKQSAARDERCANVRADLLQSHARGQRASAHSYRHLGGCADCRAYRRSLRQTDHALALMLPAPSLLAALLGGKALLGGGLVGAGKGPVAAMTAITAVSALGAGTLVLRAGDPTPVPVRSPVLPSGELTRGEPIPPGTAVVSRRLQLTGARVETELACPAGMRVADLLSPRRRGVRATYVAPTIARSSRVATIALSGRGRVAVAVLCRRPDARGSLVPPAAAGHRDTVVVGARHGYLRTRPDGTPRGSVQRDQPLTVLARRRGWLQVRSDLGTRGWIAAKAICS